MPTETFLKLRPDKRDRILAAAIEEFASHDFAGANLDRVAAGAGVSKGSLFQYFADKDDFYVYAVQAALEQAWQLYRDDMAQCAPADCYELLVETILSMAALRKREPHLATLYLRVVYAKDSHARDRLYAAFVARNREFFDRLIPWGLETGHIDPTLPEAIVRFHIHAAGSHLIYLLLSGDDPRWLPRRTKDLRAFVTHTVEVLARALAPKTRKSTRRTRSRKEAHR
ncbi:MAG: TetR/AcrR family transcriptional regulator [Planctomycetota bacterium]